MVHVLDVQPAFPSIVHADEAMASWSNRSPMPDMPVQALCNQHRPESTENAAAANGTPPSRVSPTPAHAPTHSTLPPHWPAGRGVLVASAATAEDCDACNWAIRQRLRRVRQAVCGGTQDQWHR